MILEVINRILNFILCSTGSQCNFSSDGVLWPRMFHTELVLSQNSVGAKFANLLGLHSTRLTIGESLLTSLFTVFAH